MRGVPRHRIDSPDGGDIRLTGSDADWVLGINSGIIAGPKERLSAIEGHGYKTLEASGPLQWEDATNTDIDVGKEVMMRRTHSSLPAAALIYALAATSVVAAPAAATPIATEQLGGTILSLTPQIPYENAVLRVSGPGGYALTKRFGAGSPIAADLLTDADRREGTPTGEQRRSLADGRYRYEVMFTAGGPGERQVHNRPHIRRSRRSDFAPGQAG